MAATPVSWPEGRLVRRCDGQSRRQGSAGAGRPHQAWMRTLKTRIAARGHGQSPKEGAPSSTLCSLPLQARSIGQRPLRRMRDCAVCLSWRAQLHKVRIVGYSLAHLPLAGAGLCAPAAPRASRKRDPAAPRASRRARQPLQRATSRFGARPAAARDSRFGARPAAPRDQPLLAPAAGKSMRFDA
jgi:hypothetical protein